MSGYVPAVCVSVGVCDCDCSHGGERVSQKDLGGSTVGGCTWVCVHSLVTEEPHGHKDRKH